MANKKVSAKKVTPQKKKDNKMMIIGLVAFILISTVALTMILGGKPQKETAASKDGGQSVSETVSGDGLKIAKAEVTETAKFYPYKVDNVNMEVFAVKASDGSIRTALNTCQVCYGSGRGYYKQEGNTLICQNCGNVFDVDQIEKVKNGCNPVPVGEENKKDDGSNIVISDTFMEGYKDLFLNWKQ